MQDVAKSIKEIEQEIRMLNADISKTDGLIEQGSGDEGLTKKVEQLRTEKELLRRKEEQLRAEKAELRAVLAQLRLEEGVKATLAAQLSVEALGADISRTFIATPMNQGNASSFASKSRIYTPIHGLGHLPTSFRLDPTSDQRVFRRLVPCQLEVLAERSRLLACMGERPTLAARAEDATCGVRSVLDEIIKDFPPLVSSGSSMSSYGASPCGVASPGSKPDYVWLAKGKVVGIFEVKGGAESAMVALRQAFVTATASAAHLLSLGLGTEQVVLPLAGCNGTTIQFGVLFVLSPSFPTFVATSKVLDLDDVDENIIAAAFLRKASACAMETTSTLDARAAMPPCQLKIRSLDLDLSKYHIKVLDDDVFYRGLGLFASEAGGRFDVGPGLEHMGRALTKLYQAPEAREFVAFPLSVRSPDVSAPADQENYLIVYEDLARQGFVMGSPDRLENEQLFQLFLATLHTAVAAIHAAGVLHCDLYPSNIMWKSNTSEDGGMKIKIIDWDCAHCFAEGRFSPQVESALNNHAPTRRSRFGPEHDLRYLRVLEAQRRPDGAFDPYWKALASKKKGVIDRAFYKMFSALP